MRFAVIVEQVVGSGDKRKRRKGRRTRGGFGGVLSSGRRCRVGALLLLVRIRFLRGGKGSSTFPFALVFPFQKKRRECVPAL